jgi:hypothetical protein
MQQMSILFKLSTAASSSILYRTLRTLASNTRGREDVNGVVLRFRDLVESRGSQVLAGTES